MKKVMVTGASGFIGRHALPMLSSKGYEVHAVDIEIPECGKGRVFWHKIDLLDAEQVFGMVAEIKPDRLLHLAWYTTPGKYWTSIENFRWVSASLSLFQKFYSAGGTRAVFAGTCAEYSWKDELCSEFTTPLEPATLYGICKRSLYAMTDAFSKETGLSSAWGRIFFLYGPYEHPDRVIPLVINSLLQGKPCSLSHGKQVRDFLYVEDVASAFVALMESDVRGPVNIASGKPVSIEAIVSIIEKKIGRQGLIRFGEREIPSGEPLRLKADIKRLTEEVKWSARYGLEEGIDRTLEWWTKK